MKKYRKIGSCSSALNESDLQNSIEEQKDSIITALNTTSFDFWKKVFSKEGKGVEESHVLSVAFQKSSKIALEKLEKEDRTISNDFQNESTLIDVEEEDLE